MAKKVRKVTKTGNIIKFLNSLVGTMTHNTEAVKKTASKTTSKSRSVTNRPTTTAKKKTIDKQIKNVVNKVLGKPVKQKKPVRQKTAPVKKTEQVKKRATPVPQMQITPENTQKFMGILLNKITAANQNPQRVLNDIFTLKAFLREIVAEQPSYRKIASVVLKDTQNRLDDGAIKYENQIRRLVSEFRQNPHRKLNMDGIAYDTSILDLNAGVYLEAIYRLYKKEAVEKGISEASFKRALDYYLGSKPYELYEGSLNNKGNVSRSQVLRSPREIADMAMSRAMSLNNVRVV